MITLKRQPSWWSLKDPQNKDESLEDAIARKKVWHFNSRDAGSSKNLIAIDIREVLSN